MRLHKKIYYIVHISLEGWFTAHEALFPNELAINSINNNVVFLSSSPTKHVCSKLNSVEVVQLVHVEHACSVAYDYAFQYAYNKRGDTQLQLGPTPNVRDSDDVLIATRGGRR